MKFLTLLTTLCLLASGAIAQEINKAQLAVFGKLPERFDTADNPITEEKVELGRMLYYDPRLSKSQKVSCNSCHALDKYGVDNEKFSSGIGGQLGGRNAPTVYNAAGHISQFWDGRAADVEEQAKGPVLNPVEMGMPDPEYVINVLKSIPGYEAKFKAAFPEEDDPITYDNMGKAIGVFERQLVTPSPFDDYLDGDEDALSDKEKAGLAKFLSTGCTTCHNGPLLGGMIYQKLGLVKPWPNLEDVGRSEVTGNEAEKYFFKVPSLRNVTKTGPYLHDGSIEDLGKLVGMMAEYQLGKEISEEDISDIVAFLDSLTGEIDTEYIAKPELPESGPDTPKPAES